MITLRQLQFALAVAEFKHFKKAAESCHVSQAALSLGVAELERQLGTQIFERNNKQVLITPVGQELLSRGEAIYLDAQQLMDFSRSRQQLLSRPMSIGFIHTVAPFVLPRLLPQLKAKYPNFQLNIIEDVSSGLLDKLHSGQLDCAVIALPYATPRLTCFECYAENFSLLVHQRHELANQKTVSGQQLQRDDLFLLGEGHCLKDQVLEVCQFDKNLKRQQFKQSSLNTLIQLTANNMACTLVPDMALSILEHQSELRAIPLSEPEPHRRINFVIRPNYPRLEDLQKLISETAACLA